MLGKESFENFQWKCICKCTHPRDSCFIFQVSVILISVIMNNRFLYLCQYFQQFVLHCSLRTACHQLSRLFQGGHSGLELSHHSSGVNWASIRLPQQIFLFSCTKNYFVVQCNSSRVSTVFKNVGYFAPLVFGKVVVPVDITEKNRQSMTACSLLRLNALKQRH